MTDKHTPEPWRLGTPPPNGEQTIGDSKGLMVAVATTGYGVDTQANARRIVACVNACAGISTERLEKFLGAEANKSVITLTTDNIDLKKQRDELLAAAEAAMHCIGEMGPSKPLVDAFLRLQDAIASVKESK